MFFLLSQSDLHVVIHLMSLECVLIDHALLFRHLCKLFSIFELIISNTPSKSLLDVALFSEMLSEVIDLELGGRSMNS